MSDEVAAVPDRFAPGRLSAAAYWQPAHLMRSAWIEHGSFASTIIDVLRPSRLVELGTHHGYSYFAFCEAIARLGLPTTAVAVDSWEGDEHAGFYGEHVYRSVSRINEEYSGFSTLKRSYFDAALPDFEDGSIDLLHIDGRHRYEDVLHEFTSWLPKMSPRGVMLFHDTNEFRAGFGVHQFWSEVEVQYPSFHFLHAHGLGVLGVGSELDPRVREMFDTMNAETDLYRRAFFALGADIKRRYNLESKPQRVEELESRVAEVTKALAAEERRREEEQLRLAEKQRELRAARRALSDVLESTSWKVSGPVRAVGSLLGRGRRS
jgi:predicted O-methyltransferase YrrM